MRRWLTLASTVLALFVALALPNVTGGMRLTFSTPPPPTFPPGAKFPQVVAFGVNATSVGISPQLTASGNPPSATIPFSGGGGTPATTNLPLYELTVGGELIEPQNANL